MAYDINVFREIMNNYDTRRQQNARELSERTDDIYVTIPKILQIDEKLRDIGINMSIRVISDPDHAEEILSQCKKEMFDLTDQKYFLLKKSGYPCDYLKLQYKCNVCKDTGYVDNKQCTCLKQKLVAKSYNLSNMENLFETQNFTNFSLNYYSQIKNSVANVSPQDRIQSIYNVCLNFVNSFSKTYNNLLFFGPPGIGKTFLSSCIAKELLDLGHTVVYQPAYDLFSLYEDYKFTRVAIDVARSQINRLYDVDLLIIDDLGTEVSTRTTTAFLFNLLDTRIRNKKSTIISTNQTISELNKIYSQRFSSRIFEYFTQLEFLGSDIRLQKMKENL